MADMDEKPDYSKVLEEARERFERVNSDDRVNRDNYKADLAFVYSPGAQWPDAVRATREAWKELCLEFNQLKQFVAQVVNDQLQNRPGIKVHPTNGEASEETAEILQGLIRAIEYESSADSVYKNAFKLAVAAGRGWWRVISEYDAADSFNQSIKIIPILDSNTVYADLDYAMPDGSDRNWVFVAVPMPKEDFLRQYPNREPLSWGQFEPHWGDGKDTVVVADYYRRVCKKRTLVQMSDGAVGWLDEMPKPPAGVTEQQRRDVDTWSVEWYTIAGGEQVLEKHDCPGTMIPVICTAGEDVILDGKRVYQGLTRHARDAQSMLNFGMTQQASQLALSPRAPWVMAEGQDEGYQAMWRDANTRNWSALIYKPVTVEGNIAPPPQRTQPAMVSEGWDRWCQTMIQMIKSTIGMYEQSLGQRGQEVSGRAIMAREKQGDTATFNFVHNWHNAIGLTGKIITEWIPVIYDTQRIVAIVQEDDTKKLVTINEPGVDEDDAGALEAIRRNDVTRGKYAVTIEAGPSFATRREESREALLGFVQAFPAAAQVAGDLVVRSMDIADADVLAKRLKMTLPPNILQAEEAEGEGKEPPDPAILAAMQQKDQQLQQAVQTMDQMHARIQELESGVTAKVQAAQVDAQVKASLAQQDAAFKAQQAEQEAQMALLKARIDAEVKLQAAQIDQDTKLKIAELQAAVQTAPTEEGGNPIEAVVGNLAVLTQAVASQSQALGGLAAAISAPRELVRGPDGRPVGMRIVQEG